MLFKFVTAKDFIVTFYIFNDILVLLLLPDSGPSFLGER